MIYNLAHNRNKLITFAIGSVSYQAEKDMTWGEWLSSDYSANTNYTILQNTGKAHIDNCIGKIIPMQGNYKQIIYIPDSNASNVIIDGVNYDLSFYDMPSLSPLVQLLGVYDENGNDVSKLYQIIEVGLPGYEENLTKEEYDICEEAVMAIKDDPYCCIPDESWEILTVVYLNNINSGTIADYAWITGELSIGNLDYKEIRVYHFHDGIWEEIEANINENGTITVRFDFENVPIAISVPK